jgi:hypothetical protein
MVFGRSPCFIRCVAGAQCHPGMASTCWCSMPRCISAESLLLNATLVWRLDPLWYIHWVVGSQCHHDEVAGLLHASTLEELWGALRSSGELWGALGSSGELWGALGFGCLTSSIRHTSFMMARFWISNKFHEPQATWYGDWVTQCYLRMACAQSRPLTLGLSNSSRTLIRTDARWHMHVAVNKNDDEMYLMHNGRVLDA